MSQPIWHQRFSRIDGTIGLEFQDLIEVRFVDAFRKYHIGWTSIRLAARKAAELFETDYPFSTKRFRTDGRTIFAETMDETGETMLLDLVKSQYAFQKVVSPSLYAGIEFTEEETVARWWPLGKTRQVVIDPARAFGQPIVHDAGVPTSVLASAYAVEESVERVSTLYEVKPQAVVAAIEFEQQLTA